MKTKQYTGVLSFAFLGLLMALMPVSKSAAAELLLPQQAIENASTQLKEKLQSPAFTKDFAEITEFVESVIYTNLADSDDKQKAQTGLMTNDLLPKKPFVALKKLRDFIFS